MGGRGAEEGGAGPRMVDGEGGGSGEGEGEWAEAGNGVRVFSANESALRDARGVSSLGGSAESRRGVVDPEMEAANLKARRLRRGYDPRTFRMNEVSTVKYAHLLLWFPLSLLEQFRRLANLYFLLIAIISVMPFSPVSPVTNIGPFVVVLMLSMLKELYEDLLRRRKDAEMNSMPVHVVGLGEAEWRDVAVGDIVKLAGGALVPADMVLLSTSNPDCTAYVDTANIDGETNLKLRQSPKETRLFAGADGQDEASAEVFNVEVACEAPNRSIYTFEGVLRIPDGAGEDVSVSLGPEHIILRGCLLKNTTWAYGLVVYAGADTKVFKNSTKAPSKQSQAEKMMNQFVAFLFVMLFIICCIGAIGLSSEVEQNGMDHWYLSLATSDTFNPKDPAYVGFLNFLGLIALYSTLIPISLYVSIEFIKVIQSYALINNDLDMYYEPLDMHALARTSNLNEELGQVEYIFSDKTGTLTCNQMDFFKCSIAGISYGSGVTEIQRINSRRLGKAEPVSIAVPDAEVGWNFMDARLTHGAWKGEVRADLVKEFFTLLAVCHSVIPEGGTREDIVYQASSPDERALVTASKKFGFFFKSRNTGNGELIVEEDGGGDKVYTVLHELEFNSVRKRQSVIVRADDGSVQLYCKGADDAIFQRLHKSGNEFLQATREHLEEFGGDGLRTLCLASRKVPAAEYAAWLARYEEAITSLEGREEKVAALAEEIEQGLMLIGATAIEDKLQEGVGATIEILGKAGVKVWVLTGDKMETAINIGYACALLKNDMHQFTVTGDTTEVLASQAEGSEYAALVEREVERQLQAHLDAQALLREDPASAGDTMSLIIDGKALHHALSDRLLPKMLALSTGCEVCVCCRTEPMQKALVTLMVKRNVRNATQDRPVVTLSIGDGANDVPMIQAAHVGVGISGQEGQQAVMSADFAIGRFKHLGTLLLVHGRLCYVRLSRAVNYFFYKNTTYTFTQFWYLLYSMYSGQRYYDDVYQTVFNVIMSSIPVLVSGCIDRDVEDKRAAFDYPLLFFAGPKNLSLNPRIFTFWFCQGLWHSLVCFFVFVWGMTTPGTTGDGLALGPWAVSTGSYTAVIIVINLKLGSDISHWTYLHHIAIWGSIAVWFVFVCLYHSIERYIVYWAGFRIFASASFWICLLLSVVASLLPDVVCLALRRFAPAWGDTWFQSEYSVLHPLYHHFVQEETRRITEGEVLVIDESGSDVGVEPAYKRTSAFRAPPNMGFAYSSATADYASSHWRRANYSIKASHLLSSQKVKLRRASAAEKSA